VCSINFRGDILVASATQILKKYVHKVATVYIVFPTDAKTITTKMIFHWVNYVVHLLFEGTFYLAHSI